MKEGGEGDDRDKVVGWHHRFDGHEFEQALGVGDGQESLAAAVRVPEHGRSVGGSAGTPKEESRVRAGALGPVCSSALRSVHDTVQDES